jgi:hypothetical protein
MIPDDLKIIVIINPITIILEFIRFEMNMVEAIQFPMTFTIIYLPLFFIISLTGAIFALKNLKKP